MTQKPQENISPLDLLDRAKNALTPEQYSRMHTRAIEKIGIFRLSSMNLESLKSELPSVISGDPEEQDILARLGTEFPGMLGGKNEASKEDTGAPKDVAKKSISFLKHPIDWIRDKVNRAGNAAEETVVGALPEQLQTAAKKYKKGSSLGVVATTAVAGIAAGEALEGAEKVMSWFDKLKSDPGKFFKELFDVILSFDWSRIKNFFSQRINTLGINTEIIEKFAKDWLPDDLTKQAKKLFGLEIFSKMDYKSIEKVWTRYKKNPDLDLTKELGIPEGQIKNAISIFESIFGKQSPKMLSKYREKGGDTDKLKNINFLDYIRTLSS